LFYVFDEQDERVEHVVAEVSNTPWNERHCYVLWSGNRCAAPPALRFRHPNQFHVSPFMDMEMQYQWRLTRPGASLSVAPSNIQNSRRIFDAAMTLYEKAAEKSFSGEVGARSRFMMGELYFAKKKYPEALRQFQRVIFGFGGDNAPEKIKRWKAKSTYEAARVSEVQIRGAEGAAKTKFLSDAKKYYAQVVEDYPGSAEAPLATKRLEELKKL